MTSSLLIDAINFAKTHSQIESLLNERDNDTELILLTVSCSKTLYEVSGTGYFLRVLFDYRKRNNRNTIAPDIFIDLEYKDGKFKALPAL
jgi:hypothetical protein